MKKCTKCGAPLLDEDIFCMMCGSKVEEEEPISPSKEQEQEDQNRQSRQNVQQRRYQEQREYTEAVNINPHRGRICPYCGNENSIYSQNCSNCGKNLKKPVKKKNTKAVLIAAVSFLALAILIVLGIGISRLKLDPGEILARSGIIRNQKPEDSPEGSGSLYAETPTPLPVQTETPTPVPMQVTTPTPIPVKVETPTPLPTATPVPTPTAAEEPLFEEHLVQSGTFYADDSGQNGNTSAESEYIIPNSNSTYLSEQDLKGYNKDQLQRIINEIYARRGFIFDYPENVAYFGSKSWYHGDTRDMALVESRFNDYERQNVNTIRNYQNKLG